MVAVASFINGPAILTNAQYLVSTMKPHSDLAKVTASGSVFAQIHPILLPVDGETTSLSSAPEPLPNEATLTIEKIGVKNVPIVFGLSTDADTIYKNLTNGVVHFSATPKPGMDGTSVILGHSSLYPWQANKYGAPFALLGKLSPDDRFTIRYADGKTYTFAMKESIVFNPLTADGDARLAEFERSTKPTVILVTCWPTGGSSKRISLKAELVSEQ